MKTTITNSLAARSHAQLAIAKHTLVHDKFGGYNIPAAAWDLAEATGFRLTCEELVSALGAGQWQALLLRHRR